MISQRGPEERNGDAAVDAAWRAASTEQPAPQSDAAILAAARAGTRPGANASPHRRGANWRTLWQPLAAAAGISGLVFLVVQRLPTEVAAPESMHAPAPAPAPAATDATSRPAEGSAASLAGQRAAAESAPPETAERAADLAAAAAQPSPAPAAPPQAAGLATAKSQAEATGPEAWVYRIVELHESGNLAAAADELRAFRGAYSDADARLPVELREWANSVRMDDAR